MQCLDWGQNDFSRHFREDRRDIRKISLPKKTVLFLENGYGSWQSPRMGADTLAGLPPCRHLMRPQFGSLCVRLPVSTRQRRRTRVAVEVISLEYMMMVLAGGCWCSVLVFTSLASALESPPHWTGLEGRGREREREAHWLSWLWTAGTGPPGQRPRSDIAGRLQDY